MAKCDLCRETIGFLKQSYRLNIDTKNYTLCSECRNEIEIVREINKQHEPLISEIKQKLKTEPKNSILYLELGMLLVPNIDIITTDNYEIYQMGDQIEQAYDSFLTAVAISLDDPLQKGKAYGYLARIEPIIQKRCGSYTSLKVQYLKNSLEEFEKGLSNDPDNADLLESLSEIYVLFGRYDDQMKVLTRLQEVRQREKLHSSYEESESQYTPRKNESLNEQNTSNETIEDKNLYEESEKLPGKETESINNKLIRDSLHLDKEVSVIEITTENTSGQGILSEIPEEIIGWNWGAFFFRWLWGIFNNVWISLLSVIPIVGIIICIVLGIKGNEWAWRNKQWKSIESFKNTQRKWSIAAGVVFILLVAILAAAIIIPNVGRFIGEGNDQSKITELHNVQTAVMALMAVSDSGMIDEGENTWTDNLNTIYSNDKDGAGKAVADFMTDLDDDGTTKTGCYYRVSETGDVNQDCDYKPEMEEQNTDESTSSVNLNESSGTDSRYVYEDGYIQYGADDKPIELINNSDATNPTFAELFSFLKTDTTDSKDYQFGFKLGDITSLGYVCADYAEDIHNNAEAKGIKAAWVSIDLVGEYLGHACNAFETIDQGLVFVDCTGATITEKLLPITLDNSSLDFASPPSSWDCIAYIEKGKEYGTIDIKYAQSPFYRYYIEFKQKWIERDTLIEEYNSVVNKANTELDTWAASLDEKLELVDEAYEKYNYDVYEKMLNEYNDEVDGYNEYLVYIERQITPIEERITQLGSVLGDYINESLGVVEDFSIHW